MDLGKLQGILHDDGDDDDDCDDGDEGEVMMVMMVMCGQAKVDERDGPLLRWRNIDGSHSDKLPALGATPNIFTTKQTNNEEF